jgi:hypothetical protein
VSALTIPSPYLRDGLRKLVDGLRKDAETVRLNLAEAEQDVAAARALLAEAEAQRDRAQAEADAVTAEIEFFERQAERTAPAYDPDAALAATGLMPPADDEPPAVEEAPAGTVLMSCPGCGGEMVVQDGGGIAHADGAQECPDDLTAPGVIDSPAQIAAITGGIPVVPPPVPDDPDPGVTVPDTGLAPPPLPPAPPGDGPRHASTDTSRLRAIAARVGLIHPEQGDDQ